MKKRIFFSLIFTFLGGCSTSRINHHQDAVRPRLFPNGVYYHVVTLEIKPELNQKKYTFDGVVRLTANQIIVVALSFFGTTEFKITENISSGQITSDIYRENLKKFEPQLRSLYSTLRLLLLASSQSGDDNLHWEKIDSITGLPLQITAHQDGTALKFTFGRYDENKIPEEIEISHPQFRVKVKVKRYEI